jgi:protein TonB
MLGAMVRQPHLAVPLGGDSAPVVSSRHYGDMGANDPPIIAAAGGEGPGPGLVIIGLNPSGSNADVALPPGNRDGQFTIAPANPGQASPRGEEGSYGHGGTAENGPGENASTGVGNATYEGGGGESGAGSGFVSVRSGRTGENGLSDPGPGLTAQLVYAIPEAALLRHHELVVSAGPMGGGGSNVYGVLPCGKIYTVFLATGQKEWSLQYCQKSQSTDSAENGTRRTVVHTELPILPPEAEKRYDFKRLPLPPQKAHKTILLRGTINEDGKVDNVEIYRGLQPTMDEAAQMAFRQWKFKPAMRSGKPVRVEILISIPMEPAEVSVK